MATNILFSESVLKKFCVDVLKNYSVPQPDAEMIADSLIDANLRGVDTHGIVRLPSYVVRIKNGTLKANPNITIEKETFFSAVMNGDGGFGQVIASQAMSLAIQKAKKVGIGVVAVKNSNHFGTAGYYSIKATTENLIGITLTNAAPRLPVWGGKNPVLGNNPWSVAVPTSSDMPIVLDMANSAAAMGKIRLAAKAGQKIPFGWALTKDGKPTDNPAEALTGILLPMAGHKGYGITLMVDILSGVLTGASFGTKVKESDTSAGYQDVGHLFMAIDIAAFMPFKTFTERLDALIQEVRGSELAAGVDKVYLPGEIEYLTQQKRLAEGIPLQPAFVAELKKLGEEVSIIF